MDPDNHSNIRLEAVLIQTRQPEALAGFYQKSLGLEVPRLYSEDHLGRHLANIYLGFDQASERPLQPQHPVSFCSRCVILRRRIPRCSRSMPHPVIPQPGKEAPGKSWHCATIWMKTPLALFARLPDS
jgi:hypothetical protein